MVGIVGDHCLNIGKTILNIFYLLWNIYAEIIEAKPIKRGRGQLCGLDSS